MGEPIARRALATAQHSRAPRVHSPASFCLHSNSAKDHTTNRARKLSNRDRMVGAMTLAPLKNTQPEPAPTEDTCAVKQEQASLQEQLARSNPHRRPRTLSFVADASNHSVRCSAAPSYTYMQARAFETKTSATRWEDADDEEEPALPRMPWRTAAGSAWPCK